MLVASEVLMLARWFVATSMLLAFSDAFCAALHLAAAWLMLVALAWGKGTAAVMTHMLQPA